MPIGPNSAPVESTYVSDAVPIPTGTVQRYVEDTQQAIQRRQKTMDGLNSAFAQLKANAIGQDREYLQGAIRGIEKELEQYAEEPAMVRAREARRLARRFQRHASPVQQRYKKMQQMKKLLRQQGYGGSDFERRVEALRQDFGDLDRESVESGTYMPVGERQFSEYRDLNREAQAVAGQVRAQIRNGTSNLGKGLLKKYSIKEYSPELIANVVRERLTSGKNGSYLNEEAAIRARMNDTSVEEERERILQQNVAQAQQMFARRTRQERIMRNPAYKEDDGTYVPPGDTATMGAGAVQLVDERTPEDLDKIIAEEEGVSVDKLRDKVANDIDVRSKHSLPERPEGMSKEKYNEIIRNARESIGSSTTYDSSPSNRISPGGRMGLSTETILDDSSVGKGEKGYSSFSDRVKNVFANRNAEVESHIRTRRDSLKSASQSGLSMTQYSVAGEPSVNNRLVEPYVSDAENNPNSWHVKRIEEGGRYRTLSDEEKQEILQDLDTNKGVWITSPDKDGRMYLKVNQEDSDGNPASILIAPKRGNLGKRFAGAVSRMENPSQEWKDIATLAYYQNEGNTFWGDIGNLSTGDETDVFAPNFGQIKVEKRKMPDGTPMYVAKYRNGKLITDSDGDAISAREATTMARRIIKLRRSQ